MLGHNANKISRYINNKYMTNATEDTEMNESNILKNVKNKLTELLKSQLQNNPPSNKYRISSNGKKKNDPSLYTGF